MSQFVLMDVFQAFNEVPLYHICLEVFLLLMVLWLIFHQSYNPNETGDLSKEELQALIDEWTPEELVSDVDQNHRALHPRVITSKAQKYISIDNNKCLNLATHNYLNFVGNEIIEKSAIDTIHKYGVGSCGPRGFYGTVDVHLDLENKLAEFMEMEEAVVYSYGFSTIASAIPAYAKRSDVIFVDEKVNFAIQKGLDASRSRLKFFKHNDTNDLESLLLEQAELDKKNPKKANVTRRFLIVEGIYMNTGEICPLPALIELRKKYKLRIFVDESVSFGTLGVTGRGVTEYFDVPKQDVDMIMCSMEWALGTIGGFCVGSSFIVEHQRLSGLGYCFSASLPPLLTVAASKALDIMTKDITIFSDLKDCCELMHSALETINGLKTKSHKHSPVKHLVLSDECVFNIPREQVLYEISNYCIQHGIAVIVPTYLEKVEKFTPTTSIRLTVNNKLSSEEIKQACTVLQEACNALMSH
ncbi:Serine palmitoyltransferase 1 [Gryllus bimaculatus]|nr:Serine palmitoyltransferase 1 [Gryllus bimaculatus]